MDIDGENIAGLRLLEAAAQGAGDLPSDNVNISDVLEALREDPSYDAAVAEGGLERAELTAAAAGVDRAQPLPAAGIPAVNMAQRLPQHQPTVQIVEQPAPKALRFRYECEGRSAGSIPGANSSTENKTYPTIKISNYIGKTTIVVSCVTKDHEPGAPEPGRPAYRYRPHPHNLVGREGCRGGVFTVKYNLTAESSEYQFRNLGIQCVKRRDIAAALQQRSQLRVDPFRTGFEHRNNPQSIDLNAVRLAFQVFLHTEGARAGEERLLQLPAVVSDIIYDKKAMCDLQIMRASHCSGTINGGTQIILLCEKVTRDDTVVLFYQEDGTGRVVWEAPATTVLVHKQVAIVFETPRYNPPHFDPRSHRGHITAHFRLYRPTDKQHSNSLDFEYIPDFQDSKKRKAVMPQLATYDAGNYSLEPPIKIEPNRTPPHNMYRPPSAAAAAGYADPQQGQWQGMEGGPQYGEGWAPPGGFGQFNAASPYGVSPQPSPLGALSPHDNLQSPLAPTHMHHHQMLPPPYHHSQQVGGEQMDTGVSTSLSALLEAGVNPGQLPADYELFSLEGRDNLSDSLKNLSTNDLLSFRQ